MKKLLFLLLAAASTVGLSAQVFRPDVVNGAAWGAIAGAVLGHNSGSLGHNAWRGAAYGALAGAIIGGAGDDHHRHTQVPVPRHYSHRSHYPVYVEPAYWPGYSWNDYGYGYDDYAYGYGSADGATNGLVLGGIAGAILGRNSGSLGHNAWRGAAYGALAGTILGSIHDANVPRTRRVVPARAYEYQAEEPAPAAPAAAPVTIINNYYVTTPMSGANALFGRH